MCSDRIYVYSCMFHNVLQYRKQYALVAIILINIGIPD